MRKLFFLLALIGVVSISCDGRDRVFKTNSNVLKQKSFSENISYIPENYTEVVTDTILSNGFHIKLKTYTDMEQSVLNEFKQDTINYKEYYREIVSEVSITKNSKEIFNDTIDKQFLYKIKNDLQLDNAIVNLMFDQAASMETNSIVLSAMIQKTDSKKVSFCNIIIDSEGNYKLEENSTLYAFIN